MMLTDAYHHTHHTHHLQQQQQPPPPRMRRLRRVNGNNIELSQPDSSTAAVTLTEFARRNQLPSVVRVVGGQFADIGCGSNDADAEIYVHSISSPTTAASCTSKITTSVYADVLRYTDDKENNKQSPTSAAWKLPGRYGNRPVVTGASPVVAAKRLVTTGRTICLPVDGREVAGCWFELLSEDGRAAPPIASVEVLAKRALSPPGGGSVSNRTTRYLVRQTVFGSIGSISSATVAIQPGDSLTPVRLVSSSPVVDYSIDRSNRNDKRRRIQLQCFDDRRRSVFLPLDQKGLFSPIADSDRLPEAMPPGAVGAVYDGIRSVLSSYRLPVTVRVVAGRLSIPDSIGVSTPSMIFRLTSVNNAKDDGLSNTFQTEHDEQMVYVMSLRHAWSVRSTVTSSAPVLYSGEDEVDDEWLTPLIGIPASAASRLTVVAAPRDFYVSWLSTDDGREVRRRCDRVITRHRAANNDDVSGTGKNSSTRSADGFDVASWNAPRRQTSVDSGLASSALNDDLYDEIDHIYCMIRYGPTVGNRSIVFDKPAPQSSLRQRAQSCDDYIPKAGCRIEPSGGGNVPQGVAAVLNERPLPKNDKDRINGHEEVDTRSGIRLDRAGLTAAASKFRSSNNGNIRQQQRLLEEHRSPSRIAVEITKSTEPSEERRTDSRGRSSRGFASRKSSIVAYDDGNVVADRESAIVYSDELWSDNEGESGNAIIVESTTTSADSNLLQQRKYVRQNSSRDDERRVTSPLTFMVAAERKTQATNSGRRSHSATGHRKVSASNDLVGESRRNDEVNASGVAVDATGSTPRRQSRKSTAFIAAISQSLAKAVRRVGRRSGVDEAPEVPPAVATRQKKLNFKSDPKERKSTTWYDDVAGTSAITAAEDDDNNNDIDEDVEVFDFDIGDGRPNEDVRRDWYGTSKSCHNRVDTLQPRQLLRQSHDDPPPMITASGGGDVDLVNAGSQTTKRNKIQQADLFSGHRGKRVAASQGDVLGIYTRGRCTDIGLY